MADLARSMPDRAAPMSRSAALHRNRSLTWFFVLAYGLSWGWLIPIGLSGGLVTAGKGWPTHFPALLGPLLAALVVIARQQGRAGVVGLMRRMVRVRMPLRWWLFAVSPLLVLALVLTIEVTSGRPLPAYSGFAIFSGLPSRWGVVAVAATIFLVNGFGEETGWRGFALPTLQSRLRPLSSAVIVSVAWAGWHAPMFVVVDTFRSFSLSILIGWVAGLLCGSIVLTWLYNRSGGSILLVAIWHATYNVVSGTDGAEGLLAAVSTTLVVGLAVSLVGLEVRAMRRGGVSVLGPTCHDL